MSSNHHLNGSKGHLTEILSGPFGSQVREAFETSTRDVFAESRFHIARAILHQNKRAGVTAPVTPTWGAAVRGIEDQEFTPELRQWNVHGAQVTQEVFEGRTPYGSVAPILDTGGREDHIWTGLGTDRQRQEWAYRRHQPQIEALAEAGIRRFLLEAGRYIGEGKALTRLASDYGAEEIIFSLEAPDGKVPSVEGQKKIRTFEQARNELTSENTRNTRVGIGINCVSAQACQRAVETERDGTFAAVYANKAKIAPDVSSARFLELSQKLSRSSAEQAEYLELHDKLNTSHGELAELARCCIQAKARIIGICCGGTPKDVRVLRDAVDRHYSTIKTYSLPESKELSE